MKDSLIKIYPGKVSDIVVYGANGYKDLDVSLMGLRKAANLEGTISVIGMPDLTPIPGNFPNGGAFLSEKYLACNTIGMDINCGMSLSRVDVPASHFYRKGKPKERNIRRLFDRVEDYIPIFINRSRDRLEDISMEEVLVGGVSALPDGYVNEDDATKYIENNGSLPGNVVLDDYALKLARHHMPTIGGGNHFIDLLYVDEIFNSEIANEWGLNERAVYSLIHTGSKGVGFEINKAYTQMFKEDPEAVVSEAIVALPIEHELSQKYLSAFNAGANYAYASRAVLRHQLRKAFGDYTGEELGMPLVRDSGHNAIDLENGKVLHRKGVQRVFPASDERAGIYRKTGTPIIIPGSMSTSTYILVPTERIRDTHYIINHGAGRKVRRESASRKHNDRIFREATRNIVLNIENSDYGREEAPYNYRNIDETINALEEIGLAKPIAKLQPFAVMIKGKK